MHGSSNSRSKSLSPHGDLDLLIMHGKVHQLVNHKRLLRGGRSCIAWWAKIHNINHSKRLGFFKPNEFRRFIWRRIQWLK